MPRNKAGYQRPHAHEVAHRLLLPHRQALQVRAAAAVLGTELQSGGRLGGEHGAEQGGAPGALELVVCELQSARRRDETARELSCRQRTAPA